MNFLRFRLLYLVLCKLVPFNTPLIYLRWLAFPPIYELSQLDQLILYSSTYFFTRNKSKISRKTE